MIDISPASYLQLDRLVRKFGELSDDMLDAATEAAGKYILGVLRKQLPPYTHVTRKKAYPPTGWQSARQRRFVMASIREGTIKIPYRRRSPRGGLAASWEMIGGGQHLILQNNEPHASLVYGENQARLLQLAGWRRITQMLDGMEKKITDSADRAIQRLLDLHIG